ncbi:MAG: immunoglobulin-like domain-containing protein [Patescibacteria group bacterium]
MKKLSLSLSICLILFVILGNFSLPVLAYKKEGVNLEQTKTLSDNSGTAFNKTDSLSRSASGLLQNSLMTTKENSGLEKSQQTEAKGKDYVEGEILVKYKNNKINLNTASGRTTALNFVKSKSLEKKEDLRKNNISVLKIKDSKTVEQKIAELKNDPNVEYAQPNFQYYPLTISTNDTKRAELWGLDNTGQTVNTITGTNDADIDAPGAWAINEGTNSSIIVAIIDDGVAYNHPDLVANMWDGTNCKDDNGISVVGGCNHGYDYEDGDNTPLPTSDSHGTHIAGTIAAVKNNDKGIIGIAPRVKIMALKTNYTTSQIIKSIGFATQNGAKIINVSWGGTNDDQSLKNAMIPFPGLFVVAAGNGGADQIGDNNEIIHNYPSDYNLDNIISVAATDQNDGLAILSNYGVTSIDVGAPGTNIYSTVADSVVANETFEGVTTPNVPSGWIKSGTNNKWATYNFGFTKVLYGQVPSSPYDNNTNSIITAPSVNLSDTSSAILDFITGCDTEYDTSFWRDYMALEFSSDGTNFTEVKRWDEVYLDSLNGDSSSVGIATYNFVGTIPIQYLSSSFTYRFRWVTDSSVNNFDGCKIDNVIIWKITNGSDEKYDYYSGTSMATPYVAGLAALIEGYNPNLTIAQVKNIILTTGDSIASLSGKTVSGKRINAQNALQAANPAKAITTFNFDALTPAVTGVVTEATHTIAVTIPLGSDVTALVPTIVVTGASVNPASGVAQNFTSPVTYTVTAADGSTQIYMVTVSATSDPDVVAVTADKAALIDASIKGTNADLSHVILALTNPLPAIGANGSTITWASSNTAVVSNDGQTVVRPAFRDANATVTLTATLIRGSITDTKVFVLTVLAEAINPDIASVTADKDALTDDSIRGANSDLSNIAGVLTNPLPAIGANGSTITWVSSNTAVVSSDGQTVVRPSFGNANATVTMTATITKGAITRTKEFTLTVLAETINPENHTISGTLKYYDGIKVIPGAIVVLENSIGTQIATTTTNANGSYQFTDVVSGGNYVVRVSKNDTSVSNGIDIFDLIKTRRQITEIEIFDSIFKKITADVNTDLSIDIFDLIKTRRYIAEIEPLPLVSWRFYSSDAILTTTNYLTTGLIRAFTNLVADALNQNFVGIKMGDVDNSWVSN